MATQPRTTFHNAVTIELVRARLDQRRLAERIGVAPTTLSSWLTAAAPAPVDLPARIEEALQLPAGTLSDSQVQHAA